jgi:cellulose synthase/poly-beta-1,6-N-acetylglucosamine synthase-like glycosyltransferase
MKSIEIPLQSEKTKRYIFFEKLPGLVSWSIIILPFILSLFIANVVALLIIAFFLIWFVRSIGLNVRVIQGWRTMKQHERLNWPKMLAQLEDIDKHHQRTKDLPKWHFSNLERVKQAPVIDPNEVYHAVIIATYNESRDVLEPTIKSVLASHYDMDKVIFVLAYEERGGTEVDKQAKQLVKEYAGKFYHAFAVKHPDGMANEVVGKGGNITFAARELQTYLEKQKIDPLNVIVTTLDSDNRPHVNYLAALTYTYCVSPEPQYASYQPIPIFTNNIWDVPAPMRVVATGNSFWNIILSLRPHALRNFSSHAQSMAALIDTDFWSVRTVVEDGHQFWRTYFRYDGKHEVYPIFLPIYQDAVLHKSYRKTLKAQFIQMRRWAYGASDIAYVIEKGWFTPNKVPTSDKIMKLWRLFEGHISWATAPLILAFAAFIPAWFNPDDYLSNQLPLLASRIQTFALAGILITFSLGIKALPPKPKRYKRRRTLWMILQWVYLPLTSIVYSSFAAIVSQTRLLFGRYMETFDVTEKVVKTDTGTSVSGHQATDQK